EEIVIDSDLSFDELFEATEPNFQLPKFSRLLNQMEPYGPGNMKPIFRTKNVEVGEAILLKGEHIKAVFMEGTQQRKIPAIGFRMAELFDIVQSGKKCDILYTVESNTWKEKTTIQLNLKDIRVSE
ncbi:MAG: single-stranded-DNA-specific exonuclease RecJ, partial [Crocinitomicaceae bacterium]|nr:single-stranded-DNA-specific exonuclease RecJ [Crocinitomicaceae bacterium]